MSMDMSFIPDTLLIIWLIEFYLSEKYQNDQINVLATQFKNKGAQAWIFLMKQNNGPFVWYLAIFVLSQKVDFSLSVG